MPLDPLVHQLPVHGIAALMCVEATAQACHRSLVAARLAERYGVEIAQLEPSRSRPGSTQANARDAVDLLLADERPTPER